jgi:hypothetical protein
MVIFGASISILQFPRTEIRGDNNDLLGRTGQENLEAIADAGTFSSANVGIGRVNTGKS